MRGFWSEVKKGKFLYYNLKKKTESRFPNNFFYSEEPQSDSQDRCSFGPLLRELQANGGVNLMEISTQWKN